VQLTYQGETYSCVSENASLGGLFLRIEDPIPFGAVVQVSFELPDLPSPVVVDAHVRWVQAGVGIGIQFQSLRAREVWALQKLFQRSD
jgi:Tfp pilus assembly protein PilZ